MGIDARSHVCGVLYYVLMLVLTLGLYILSCVSAGVRRLGLALSIGPN
jgi:hypothetical protein